MRGPIVRDPEDYPDSRPANRYASQRPGILASWRSGTLAPWHPGTLAREPEWHARYARVVVHARVQNNGHALGDNTHSAQRTERRTQRRNRNRSPQPLRELFCLPTSQVTSSPGTKSPSLQVFKLKSKFKCLCPCSRPCPCPCSRLCSNPSFSCRCSFLFYLLIMVVGVWGTTPFLASTIATSSGISPNHPTIANYILFTANSPLPTLYWFSISFISLSICTQTPTPMYFCI